MIPPNPRPTVVAAVVPAPVSIEMAPLSTAPSIAPSRQLSRAPTFRDTLALASIRPGSTATIADVSNIAEGPSSLLQFSQESFLRSGRKIGWMIALSLGLGGLLFSFLYIALEAGGYAALDPTQGEDHPVAAALVAHALGWLLLLGSLVLMAVEHRRARRSKAATNLAAGTIDMASSESTSDDEVHKSHSNSSNLAPAQGILFQFGLTLSLLATSVLVIRCTGDQSTATEQQSSMFLLPGESSSLILSLQVQLLSGFWLLLLFVGWVFAAPSRRGDTFMSFLSRVDAREVLREVRTWKGMNAELIAQRNEEMQRREIMREQLMERRRMGGSGQIHQVMNTATATTPGGADGYSYAYLGGTTPTVDSVATLATPARPFTGAEGMYGGNTMNELQAMATPYGMDGGDTVAPGGGSSDAAMDTTSRRSSTNTRKSGRSQRNKGRDRDRDRDRDLRRVSSGGGGGGSLSQQSSPRHAIHRSTSSSSIGSGHSFVQQLLAVAAASSSATSGQAGSTASLGGGSSSSSTDLTTLLLPQLLRASAANAAASSASTSRRGGGSSAKQSMNGAAMKELIAANLELTARIRELEQAKEAMNMNLTTSSSSASFLSSSMNNPGFPSPSLQAPSHLANTVVAHTPRSMSKSNRVADGMDTTPAPGPAFRQV